MKRPDSAYVARVPLFDRLTDLDPLAPSEPQPLRALTRAQLLDSIHRELSALLNTRCPIAITELLERPRSVIDYGLTELTWVGPMAPEDRARLALLIERAVAAFEPRLRAARVQIGEYDQAAGSLRCEIEAELVTETLREAVSFPIAMSNARGRQNG